MALDIEEAEKIASFDVVIIGGGLVGASLAVALAPTNQKVLVIEPAPFNSEEQPSFDERTVALTHSAKLVFSAIGVWPDIKSEGATPILDIHISNRGHFGQTHLSCKQTGTEALGYVVPTRVVGNALWKAIKQCKNTTVLSPGSAQKLEQKSEHCLIHLNSDQGPSMVSAKLVVVADGGRSALTKHMQTGRNYLNYHQSAILSIVSVDRAHNGLAYERFTDQGPLALLPHSGSHDETNRIYRYAVVWSTSNKNVAATMALSDEEFIARLQTIFGDRAGNFADPSPRKTYPLKRTRLSRPAGNRVIILGNAAHTVHPVAGQGFNLGLRDVASLAELIFTSPQSELGSDTMIEHYLSSRKHDALLVDRFTHSLIEIFSSNIKPLALARNLGLAFIEHTPPVKRFLLKRTLGLAGTQSRLAMGIPLTRS